MSATVLRISRGAIVCCAAIAIIITVLLTMHVCQADPLAPGDYARSLVIHGVTRTYLLHVPPPVEGRDRLPMVLLLHGMGVSGSVVARATGMAEQADKEGYYLVCPDAAGEKKRWNTGAGTPEDLAFLTQLLDKLVIELPVDKQRCYASGYSSGAVMCYRLALDSPHRLAAIAPVCGTLERATSLQAQMMRQRLPVPVMLIYGELDKEFPCRGKTMPTSPRYSADETIDFWVKYNHCTAMSDNLVLENGSVILAQYIGKRPEEHVVFVTVKQNEHEWPGSTIIQQQTRPTLHSFVMSTMWDFLRQQSR